MYPQWMWNLLKYYNLWGFRTDINPSHRFKKLTLFISLLHLILIINITVAVVHFLLRINEDTLGTINDTVKYIGALVMHWTIVIESNGKTEAKKQL